MKFRDIPNAAWDAEPTTIPTKTEVSYDWEAMHQLLEIRGFVVIESNETRIMANGAEECVPVKQFNCYMRATKKEKLFTKRLSATRWVCTL
jgi:hypothetical protein